MYHQDLPTTPLRKVDAVSTVTATRIMQYEVFSQIIDGACPFRADGDDTQA
jgi:hypothetical protein